jgi:hypothetical protein
VQIGRLSNGKRRILSITEVTGLGDNIISTQELYRHEPVQNPDGTESDRWQSLGILPHSPKLARMRPANSRWMTALISSASLFIAAIAMIMVGLGLLMLAAARSRSRAEDARAHLTAQTEQVRARYATVSDPTPQSATRDLRRRWDDLMRRADLKPTRRTYLVVGVPMVLAVLGGAIAGGGIGAGPCWSWC